MDASLYFELLPRELNVAILKYLDDETYFSTFEKLSDFTSSLVHDDLVLKELIDNMYPGLHIFSTKNKYDYYKLYIDVLVFPEIEDILLGEDPDGEILDDLVWYAPNIYEYLIYEGIINLETKNVSSKISLFYSSLNSGNAPILKYLLEHPSFNTYIEQITLPDIIMMLSTYPKRDPTDVLNIILNDNRFEPYDLATFQEIFNRVVATSRSIYIISLIMSHPRFKEKNEKCK